MVLHVDYSSIRIKTSIVLRILWTDNLMSFLSCWEWAKKGFCVRYVRSSTVHCSDDSLSKATDNHLNTHGRETDPLQSANALFRSAVRQENWGAPLKSIQKSPPNTISNVLFTAHFPNHPEVGWESFCMSDKFRVGLNLQNHFEQPLSTSGPLVANLLGHRGSGAAKWSD